MESSLPGIRVQHKKAAFTLLEMLVSIVVLTIFVLVLSLVTDSSQKLWRRTSSSIQMFASAREAFDVMTKRLSQATLNPYLDYYDSSWNRRDPTNTSFVPAYYGRASDLDFCSGTVSGTSGILGSGTYATHGAFFFAPLGFTDNNVSYRDLPNLLNPVAYYVEFADDSSQRPQFLQNANLPSRYRYRLVEVVQPAQNFTGYTAFTDTDPTNDTVWITGSGGLKSAAQKHFLAENVIALVIRPQLSQQDATTAGLVNPWNLTSGYSYNSRAGRGSAVNKMQFAQLPPLLQVLIVCVDESAAARLTTGSVPPALFDTSMLFADPNNMDADLQTLETRLSAAKVQFRTFSSVIGIRAAKWSVGN